MMGLETLDFARFEPVASVSASDGSTAAHAAVTERPQAESLSSSEQTEETGLISDLALILVVAGLATVVFRRLKQPVVLGYILAGFLVGPHFGYFPTVVHEGNVEFWAELGIIFLLFSLGLEFSFKKLVNVGGSAATTALVIVFGMMATGFFAGSVMGFSHVSSLFLGGMLSMSSTTIIMKALDDLGMRQRRFAPQVLAVLIVEDLFAVVLMVVLSSIAINNSFSGEALLWSVLKLVFFLVLWFLVGVYLIPSFLSRQRRFLTDELLLVLAVGLCFLMVITSTYAGFSSALGAFLMGSVLAGTSEAERIGKLVSPVKNLFGAVFFVSVGMMVDPHILSAYAVPILSLSAIVVAGMILFGTFGMLVAGQPMRIAIESGFSLTQIGEFSFIIASLGMSLGVIDGNLYPIIVSVSVITTFFTPYSIKASDPFSRWVERKMPVRLKTLLDRYSTSVTRNETEMSVLWKQVLRRSVLRILVYSVVLLSVILLSRHLLFPLLTDGLGDFWGNMLATAVTLSVMAPFLLALCYPGTKRWEREKLQRSVNSNAPFVAMRAVRVMTAFGFLLFFLLTVYSHLLVLTVCVALFSFAAIYFSQSVRKRMGRIEAQFVENLNERDLRRSGRNNNIVSDMHLAYVDVGYGCPFAGERLSESGIGRRFGVNVASIRRGDSVIPVPTGADRVFPGDTLGVIGTDEQIQKLLGEIGNAKAGGREAVEMEFTSVELSAGSPVAGRRVGDCDLRGGYSVMLVSIERPDGTFEKPTADSELRAGDNLWVVGDKNRIKALT